MRAFGRRVIGFGRSLDSRGDKAESLQDAARLVGGEVCAVEAGREHEDLLWRIAPTVDYDVMLMDRFRQNSAQPFLDRAPIDLELLPRDLKRRHLSDMSSLICLYRMVSD